MKAIYKALISAVVLCSAANAYAAALYDWVPLSGQGDASGSLQIDQWNGGDFTWSLDWSLSEPAPGPYGGIQMTFEYYGHFEGIIQYPLGPPGAG